MQLQTLFGTAASLVGAGGVIAWRLHETRRAVTPPRIVIPPLGMSTGLAMFFSPGCIMGGLVGRDNAEPNGNRARTDRGCCVGGHLIASGLTGDPTAPVIGIAGATNMNS